MNATTKKTTMTAKRSTTARKATAKATTTRKAPAKRTAAAKPVKAVSKVAATVAAETQSADVAALKVKTLYLVDVGTPYGCYKSNDIKGAYTQAMLELTELATRTAKGAVLPVKAKPETIARRVAIWGKFVQRTAFNHWRNTRGLIDMHGLTAEGSNEAQARIEGRSAAFRTNVELVEKVKALLVKGGTLTHGGETYKFAFKRDLTV